MNWLLGSGIAYFAYKGWAIYQASQKLAFDFRDITNVVFTGNFIKFNLRLYVTNPSPESIKVSSVSGNVFYDGYNLGSFIARPNIVLNGNSKSPVDVPIQVNLLNAAGNTPGLVVSLLNGKASRFDTQGVFSFYGISVPFNFPYQLSIKQFLPADFSISLNKYLEKLKIT
ncbi:MAG: hypothetical protein ACXWW0_00165 [Bacteroidia bacterium]